MNTIEDLYQHNCRTKSDIFRHLPTLRDLTEAGSSVVEIGLRGGVSTTAFLVAGAMVTSYDIKVYTKTIEQLRRLCPDTFRFVHQSSLKAVVPECDGLFIDSEHKYDVLRAELSMHGNKAGRWIAMHDTEKFKHNLQKAIDEFLRSNRHWRLEAHYDYNNGLTVLRRCS